MNKGEEICRCHICGSEMKLKNLQWHLRSHEIKPEDYYCEYIGEKKYCPICGKETPFNGLTHGYKEGFCSYRCEQISKGVDVESDSYKKMHHCLICGVEMHQLRNHLRTVHGVSNKDYYDKYYKTEGEGLQQFP